MALETMNEKVTNKIKSELFQANERDYYLLNGNKNLCCASTCFVLNNNRENIPVKEDVAALLDKALDSSYHGMYMMECIVRPWPVFLQITVL